MGFSGAHTNPGTPEHGDVDAATTRSQISPSALVPFNSGRVLPSKWDDAERWITSPLSGVKTSSVSQPPAKQKSKSGPLAPPCHFLSQISMANSFPAMGSTVHNNTAFSDHSSNSETGVTRGSDSKSKDEELVPEGACCRDVGTQMSPAGSSSSSSPRGRLSFSAFSSAISCFRNELRDVHVRVDNKGATSSRSRRQNKGFSGDAVALSLPWTASRNHTCRLQREEAEITAWENLQKAKAEAAVRKLEMTLEKKRSAAMDRITSKLRASQMKAEARRISMNEEGLPQNSCCLLIKPRFSSRFLLCRRI